MTKRGRGRPPIGRNRMTCSFNTRLDYELRAALDKAAMHNGRSLSAEILDRLRKSFHRDEPRVILSYRPPARINRIHL